MSRSTASPPPNEASGPNGDRRASEATTTRVKPMRPRRVSTSFAGARTAPKSVP